MTGRFSRSIYVGNLPADIKELEVEDLFYKYGRVKFESSRDAEDAIRGRDGYNFDGCRLRVDFAHRGRGPSSSSDRRGSYGSSGGGGGGGGRHGISRHFDYRVIIRGLPSSGSWQDLKDHMRKAGDGCFAEVSRDSEGTFGLVDYTNYEDMKYAEPQELPVLWFLNAEDYLLKNELRLSPLHLQNHDMLMLYAKTSAKTHVIRFRTLFFPFCVSNKVWQFVSLFLCIELQLS